MDYKYYIRLLCNFAIVIDYNFLQIVRCPAPLLGTESRYICRNGKRIHSFSGAEHRNILIFVLLILFFYIELTLINSLYHFVQANCHFACSQKSKISISLYTNIYFFILVSST